MQLPRNACGVRSVAWLDGNPCAEPLTITERKAAGEDCMPNNAYRIAKEAAKHHA